MVEDEVSNNLPEFSILDEARATCARVAGVPLNEVPTETIAAYLATELVNVKAACAVALTRAEKAEHRAEMAEAKSAVFGGEWCAENRAAGRNACDCCSWCCKQARERAEKAEAERDALRKRIEEAAMSDWTPTPEERDMNWAVSLVVLGVCLVLAYVSGRGCQRSSDRNLQRCDRSMQVTYVPMLDEPGYFRAVVKCDAITQIEMIGKP